MKRSKENFVQYSLGFLLAFIALNAFGGGYYGMSVFARFRFARISAFTAVGIVFVWLAIQLSVIGYVSWMQPTTASLGLLVLILTFILPAQKNITNNSDI